MCWACEECGRRFATQKGKRIHLARVHRASPETRRLQALAASEKTQASWKSEAGVTRRERLVKRNVRYWQGPRGQEHRRKQAAYKEGFWALPGEVEKQRERAKCSLLPWARSVAGRTRVSESQKARWERMSPEERRTVLERMHLACGTMRPNYPEQRLLDLLEEFHLPYKYVGDGKFYIGSKNPDFVRTSGRKVIEFFGRYWHEEEDESRRKKIFQELGWDTCVIWEEELGDMVSLKKKLLDFDA